MRQLIFFLFLILNSQLFSEPLSFNVNAQSAILMNADTGTILFEKDAHALRYPASTTKIATGVYALTLCRNNLDDQATADQDAIATVSEAAKKRSGYTLPSYWNVTDGDHIGIKKGEKMSLRTLFYGMMLASGNDASNMLAMHLSGTVPKFMDDLNVYLKKIGCRKTLYNNPHGLHHPKHQTTAYDLAVMTREGLKDPIFREIVSTIRYPRPKTNKQDASTLLNTNRLLRKGKNYYAKAIGVKTGHTSAAGYNLVAAAKDGDRTLIAVVMKCDERNNTFEDVTNMFETAFNQPRVRRLLLKNGPQKFLLELPGASDNIKTWIRDDVTLEYYPAEEPRIKTFLFWTASNPPVAKNQVVGELRIQKEDGSLIQKVPLLAQQDVSASWWWSTKKAFSGGSAWKWIGVIIALVSMIGLLFQLRRHFL